VAPNEVQTRGGLWNMACVTPSAHILHLRAPKSFFLACLHLCLVTSGVFNFVQNTAEPPSHSALALQNWGPNLRGLLKVDFTWRRRLAPNSSPSKAIFNPDESNLWALYRKRHPRELGLKLSFDHYCRYLQKKACARYHRTVGHGNTPYLCKEYYHTWLCGDIACRYAWPVMLPPLRCATLSSLAIWY
jgi:hypothetical protein